MNDISLNELGITGPDDPYHFQKPLNRITIDTDEHFRLVVFCIREGTEMPLHDHPNMGVFFR